MDMLLNKLEAANNAYRNTGKLLMTDEEYDRGIEELRLMSPNHPFLKQIGAVPLGKTVTLPSTMASLDKIHDSDSLERWKKGVGASSYIISEKLDGISCLYCVKDGKASMYLRGDGVKGVDVSGLVGLVKTTKYELPTCMVRGELIIRKADTPAGSIGRSLINGWVHRLETAKDKLTAVRFVAYELISPPMPRRDQFTWLKDLFELPWYRVLSSAGLRENYLNDMIQARRRDSDYATDGIVVADASATPDILREAKNPKDAMAFKIVLDDQKAETVITSIEWNLSRQGMIIPTILIEPVTIGDAKIGRLSGHNAGLIYREKLGPGASIVVRRSGDVIPTLDSVISCTEPSMPSMAWSWGMNSTHAMASATGLVSKAAASKALLHALQTLEIDGVGPGLAEKLVEAGFDTLKKCMDATDLSAAVGSGRGPKLLVALRSAVASASLMKMMIASNLLPRGVGERKLKMLFEVEADPSKWTFEKLCNVNGWGSIGIQDLLKIVPAVLEWCQSHKPYSSTGASPTAPLAPLAPSRTVASKGSVVFTGVRDKDVEAKATASGWIMSDAITKKTSILVVADDGKESVKTKKATEYGIRIMKISEFRQIC
jgi:DNA ligase (NAD+)